MNAESTVEIGPGHVVHTLTLRGLDNAALDAALVEALRSRGYLVMAPDVTGEEAVVTGNWETPYELATRVGIHPGSLRRMMDRPGCPKPEAQVAGKSGRRTELVSTPELDAYLVKNKGGVQ